MKLVRYAWTFVGMVVLLTYVSWAGWFSDVQKGLETARKENKVVVFYFYSDYCPYCKQVEEFVLSTEDFSNATKNMVFIPLNISSDEGSQWARKLGVPGVPTFVVYDPRSDRRLGALFGSRPKGDILNYLKNTCKANNFKTC